MIATMTTHAPTVSIIATALSALAAAISAGAAWRTIYKQGAQRENERLLNHAVTTLERSFDALMDGNHDQESPPPNRLAWLTSARLILEFEETKKQLKDKLLLRELESHQEYWRHQFYLKLKPINIPNRHFFKQDKKDFQERIELTSAVVIHSFADWPEGQKDPIKSMGGPLKARDALRLSEKWFELDCEVERLRYPTSK